MTLCLLLNMKGGTIIGTARCQEFRAKEGRIKAAKNLIARGISNLVILLSNERF